VSELYGLAAALIAAEKGKVDKVDTQKRGKKPPFIFGPAAALHFRSMEAKTSPVERLKTRTTSGRKIM
jgi:hypothetical protein